MKHFQPLAILNDRLKQYPTMFWGIIWVFIAFPSALAIGSLINPNATEPQMVSVIAQKSDTKTQSPLKPVPDSGQLPLWVFGAIAVGCTASCFVLAIYIKPIEMQTAEIEFEETVVPIQSAAQERSHRQIDSPKQLLKRLKPYELTEVLPFMQTERSQPIQPLAVEWMGSTQQIFDSAYSTDDIAEPVLVSVIPAEEIQPLDWGEARLADVMDLRRQYPLHFVANTNSQS
ncbi:hypothetical protein JOY44_01925 [Phormidium sp. CLA17]|uniref:hypothetical protein n=1 Tax=Leptolyngbya sp. Cla-17 TaxID=2803751 RepID=UPI001491FD2F|nr:hypothetical protein [Leptolyngbya sp. Cla-17]MBM0740385.1 hypothetical protein [Leptolyngbya sp. Cla-17]